MDGRTILEWIEEIGIIVGNLVDSAQDRDCECGIELPGSISYGVSYIYYSCHDLILVFGFIKRFLLS